MFNAVGDNFEYKPVEIIDTFPKLIDFLDNNELAMWIENGKVWFSRSTDNSNEKDYTINLLEIEFAIELKIFMEGISE